VTLRWNRKPSTYLIEVASRCNLRCPSCPNGNYSRAHRPSENMDSDLFSRIIRRIADEVPHVDEIHLYNWSEPTLHPQLPDFVRQVKARRMPCVISTNLNVSGSRLEEVVVAGPDSIRVSISGSCQESYGITHEGGRIETVKSNMEVLHRIVASADAPPSVEVLYHLYTHNVGSELDEIASLSERYGFRFFTCWAYLMPVEQQLAYLGGTLNDRTTEFVQRLAVRPDEARAVSMRHATKKCRLRDTQMAINADGSVDVCCAVFGERSVAVDSFLDADWREIAARKKRAAICLECMKDFVHLSVIYAGSDNLNAIAEARLASLGEPRPSVMPSF
jgi:MoaA/NifB/PqqE/SkfB family radical SAM enzyme